MHPTAPGSIGSPHGIRAHLTPGSNGSHSNGAHWIQPGFIEFLGALDHLHPPRHWVPSGDLRPAWLLCMITGTVKGWAVIGCLPIILLEAGL